MRHTGGCQIMSKPSLMRRFCGFAESPSPFVSAVVRPTRIVHGLRMAVAVPVVAALVGCTNGTYDCEGTDLVIDGSRIEYAGADRYEVCQTNGNILVIGLRDQCGTTSRNYMSFDKMQRKLARGTEKWDCKKK